MNIFVLDYDVSKIPEVYCDQHVVKMILETAQLLCSVHHMSGNTSPDIPYKLTHKNHPCAVWARQSEDNYKFLCCLGMSLCIEYSYRFNKEHACTKHIDWLRLNIPYLPSTGFTEPPQCVSTSCKRSSVVEAYRAYYIEKYISWKEDKRRYMRFTNRDTPDFLLEADILPIRNMEYEKYIKYYKSISKLGE